MPEDVRIWEILQGDTLKEIAKAELDSEGRIEDWLERDISIISNDLLVIGRQVGTDFGGVIDILCLDRNGNIVIIELKRDKTPREVTAQTLDYASWVKDLSNDRVTEIANKYLDDRGPLEEAFRAKFGTELPETLNEHHTMLVVASEIDSSSERIIKYLSDSYGVPVNAATFKYFRNEDGKEFLARVFLVEPSEVEYRSQTKIASKSKRRLTFDELQEAADSRGIGDLYKKLVEDLTGCFDFRDTTKSSVAFDATMGDSRNRVLNLVPNESDPDKGVQFQVYIDRFAEYLGVGREEVLGILPSGYEEGRPWKGAPQWAVGFFKDGSEAEKFVMKLKELKAK